MDNLLFDPSDLAAVLNDLNEANVGKDFSVIDESLGIEMEAAQKRVEEYMSCNK